MCIDFKLWKEVLTKPIETFKKQEKNADLGEAVKQLVIAGLIAGFISGLAAFAGLTAVGATGNLGTSMMGAGVGIFAFIAVLIVTPIVLLIGWLIGSAIIYVFAKIFNGKGDFTKQSYLIALFWAPLVIVTTVIGIIPFIGAILGFLVGLYGLYLLTLALKQAHKVSTARAVAIWIVPIVISILLVMVLASAFLLTMLPLMVGL